MLLAPALLLAQTAIVRPPSTYAELKGFLNLTDGQVQSLADIQNNRNQALQAIYTQINDKYTVLYNLMNAGTGTAQQLGQLLLDIGTLQKQIPASESPYRTQAVAILNPDQKTKLATLNQAMQLQPAIWQAVDLLLIDNSNPIGIPVDIGIASTASANSASAPAALLLPSPQGIPAAVNRMAPVAVH
jgi:hypothetical protein